MRIINILKNFNDMKRIVSDDDLYLKIHAFLKKDIPNWLEIIRKDLPFLRNTFSSLSKCYSVINKKTFTLGETVEV